MSCTPQYTIRNAGRQTKSSVHCFQTPFLTHIHVYSMCMSLKEREGEHQTMKREEMESGDENVCG